MKQSLILSSIFLVGMELFSSCTDKFESMNTNPGAVTEASLKYILPYVQEVGATLIVHLTKEQTTYMRKCIDNILQMQTPALHPTDTVTTIHGPMKGFGNHITKL